LLTSDALNGVADVSLQKLGGNINAHQYQDAVYGIRDLLVQTFKTLQRPVLLHVPCGSMCEAIHLLSRMEIKFALVTMGRDDRGSPIPTGCGKGHVKPAVIMCFKQLMDLEQNVVYFTSQHKSSYVHRKLRVLPIRFGENHCKTAYGTSEKSLRDAHMVSYHYFDIICERNNQNTLTTRANNIYISHGDGSFKNHTYNPRTPQRYRRIRHDCTKVMQGLGAGKTVYGQFPRERQVPQAATAIVGSSPRGTGADCHRHFELLLSGQVVSANYDEAKLSPHLYSGLPIYFVEKWKDLTFSKLTNITKRFLQFWTDLQIREIDCKVLAGIHSRAGVSGRESTPGWLPREFQEMAQTLSDLALHIFYWRFIFLDRNIIAQFYEISVDVIEPVHSSALVACVWDVYSIQALTWFSH